MNDFFLNSLLVFAFLFCVFLLLREIMTWYWKQNEIVNLLKEQNRLLRILVDEEQPDDEEIMDNGEILDNDDLESKIDIEPEKKSFKDKVNEAEEELKSKKREYN